MISIRITTDAGKSFFISENHKGILLVNNIQDSFKYQSTLEFKVTWRRMKIMKNNYEIEHTFEKELVINFESIDSITLEIIKFDVTENEFFIGDEIYVDLQTFNRLKKCGITCSHWLYDKNDDWLAFPNKNDYDKVTKIKYFVRGLTDVISSYNNWNNRYDEHSWHGCFEAQHKCMLNAIIQQIYLLNFDSCHMIMVYPLEN